MMSDVWAAILIEISVVMLAILFEVIAKILKGVNSISSPPGSTVLKVAEFLCTKNVHERVFLQAVLDMREEYNEALFSGRKEKARWVLIRGYLWLAWSVTLQVVEFLLSGPAKIIKTLWTST